MWVESPPPPCHAYPGNVAPSCSDVVHGQSDAPGRLRDVGAGLEGVVDPLDAVLLHADEEAGGQLGTHRPCVEEGRGGVCEPPIGHQVVRLQDKHSCGSLTPMSLCPHECSGRTHTHTHTHTHLNSSLYVLAMNSYSHSHQHVLWALSNYNM